MTHTLHEISFQYAFLSFVGFEELGHILRRNCLLKQVIEGKIELRIEMT